MTSVFDTATVAAADRSVEHQRLHTHCKAAPRCPTRTNGAASITTPYKVRSTCSFATTPAPTSSGCLSLDASLPAPPGSRSRSIRGTSSRLRFSRAFERSCSTPGPPFALDAVELRPDGNVRLHFKQATVRGQTFTDITPNVFLARLVALVPPPPSGPVGREAFT